jgi:hypothetical protein
VSVTFPEKTSILAPDFEDVPRKIKTNHHSGDQKFSN